ncbi:MAG TPA: Rho termination factor N-terminal domain-containing protein [Solirubrobacteraceae bacterium]|nr:Rho termination factor N-terminal domain-containing protein [Solirubrobacteraceae bacterium]
MSVLDRSALVDSPLADLHAIASELTIDGYRRLRRDELIEAILEKQGDEPAAEEAPAEESTGATRRRRSRRPSRGAEAAEPETVAKPEEAEAGEQEPEEAPKPRRSRSRARRTETEEAPEAAEVPEEEKPSRSRRARRRTDEERPAAPESGGGAASEEEVVEGSVEVLANGSGFVRLGGTPEEDVYISSAQVKRCELVTGDTVSGPKRAPRRSERFASLIRIETINGRPASEQADSVRFDELAAALPAELIDLSEADAELKAVQATAPIGRGSRVTITGASRAGKSELLRRIAAALSGQAELTVTVALAGVRPEELGAWGPDAEPALPAPATAISFAASEDARAAALEAVVDQARRLAARGSHAVVLIDTLDGLSGHAARKLTAAARNLTAGGSVTIIATAGDPVGGETTVIALDPAIAGTGRHPAVDVLASGALRPELLIGETAARRIGRERAKALKD